MTSASLGLAARATFQSFANCYIREVDAGKRCAIACSGTARDGLEWYLARQRLYLRAVITADSHVGPTGFDRLYCCHAPEDGWREMSPLWAVQCMIHELCGQASTQVSGGTHAELELMMRTLHSCQRMEASLAASADATPGSDGFIESEQSLIFGHWLHPTPKSLQGMSDWQARAYAPEASGRFRLHFFAAPRDRISARSVDHDSVETIVASLCGDLKKRISLHADEQLLPMHPLQAEALLLRPQIQALITRGELRHLGPAGPDFTATSSVRTVCSEQSRWMLKFSLPVKITNSLRLNRRHELEAGVAMADLVRILKLEERLPKLTFLKDPAYLTLDIEGEEESGFEVIFRANPFTGEAGDHICSIAALAAAPPPGQFSRMTRTIHRLSETPGLSLEMAAMRWFEHYLECVVGSLVRLYDETGIALEAHQQNMLLDLSEGYPNRAIYRDSQGFYLSERHRQALVACLPELARIESLFFADPEISRRLGYYLFVNQVFAVIHRMAMDGLAPERVLIDRLRRYLRSLLPGLRGVGGDFVLHLLESRTITTKANLGVRVANIDELEHAGGASLYREMSNPLHPGTSMSLARFGDALAS